MGQSCKVRYYNWSGDQARAWDLYPWLTDLYANRKALRLIIFLQCAWLTLKFALLEIILGLNRQLLLKTQITPGRCLYEIVCHQDCHTCMHWFNNRSTNNNWLKFVSGYRHCSGFLVQWDKLGLGGPTEDMGVLQVARGSNGDVISPKVVEKSRNQLIFKAILLYSPKCKISIKTHSFLFSLFFKFGIKVNLKYMYSYLEELETNICLLAFTESLCPRTKELFPTCIIERLITYCTKSH